MGRLRRLLFKPPSVRLELTDDAGATSSHRLPGTVGETGFLVSPFVRDLSNFLRAANGEPGRRIVALAIETSAQDRD